MLMDGTSPRIVSVLVASALWSSCAPVVEQRSSTVLSRDVERVEESHDGLAGVGWFRARREEQNVRVDWRPGCHIVQTDRLVVREEVQRHPDTAVFALEVSSAAVGALLLGYAFSDGEPTFGEEGCTASSPPQCHSESGKSGGAFVVGLPLFLAGGIATIIDLGDYDSHTLDAKATEETSTNRLVPCERTSVDGHTATLVMGEHAYTGKFDSGGSALIQVPTAEWEQGVRATLVLDGVEVGPVTLVP